MNSVNNKPYLTLLAYFQSLSLDCFKLFITMSKPGQHYTTANNKIKRIENLSA
jgi:hypothetical protein